MSKVKMNFMRALVCAGLVFALCIGACTNPSSGGPAPAVLNVTITSGKGKTVYPGDTLDFQADVTVSGKISNALEWTVTGNTSNDTIIEANNDDSRIAVLTIGEDESPGTITVKAASVEDSQKSDTAAVEVLPSGVLFDKIFLVGGSSPTGWETPTADSQMTAGDNDTYTWTGYLTGGALQFATAIGSQAPDFTDGSYFESGYWFVPAVDNILPSASAQAVEFGVGQTEDRDRRIRIPVEGNYTIVLDAGAGTVAFTAMPDVPAVNYLWMVGDATLGGWNLPWSRPLVKSGNVFTYTGMMSPENFRFIITDTEAAPQAEEGTGNWNIHPQLIRNPDWTSDPGNITGQAQPFIYIPPNGPEDTNWAVPDAAGFGRAMYTVTVDTAAYTFRVERANSAAGSESVYVFGPATGGDWSLGAAANRMTTSDGVNFTWSGMLSADEIAFAYGDSDSFNTIAWSSPFFVPPDGSQNAGTTGAAQDVEFDASHDDRNFTVSSAGPYTVTLNINTLKAAFTLNPAVYDVTVTASKASANPDEEVEFTAAVNGTPNADPTLVWTISSNANTSTVFTDTSLNNKRTLKIGSDEPQGKTITVRAASAYTAYGEASVLVTSPDINEVVSVSVSQDAPGANIGPGKTVAFTAAVVTSGTNPPDDTVTWSVSGAGDPNTAVTANPADSHKATLTIGANENDGAVITVKAASAADSSKVDSVAVNVKRLANVYLVGGAGPSGWSTPIFTDSWMTPGDNYTFTWSGNLKGGSLLFVTDYSDNPLVWDGNVWGNGNWFVSAVKNAKPLVTPQPVEFGVGQNSDDRNKPFRISVDGDYTIVLDAANDTVSFTAIPAPSVNYVWMVGDASISGWNLPLSRELTKSGNVFIYTGLMIPGNFRFFVTDTNSAPQPEEGTGNWNIYPQLIRDPDATEDPGNITGQPLPAIWIPAGDPRDTNWAVPDTTAFGRAIYTVTIDPVNYTINAVKATDNFTSDATVYMCGPATGNSWDLTTMYPMATVDGITYTGSISLSADAFFLTYGNA
ncbi:MAG: SusF/SusE family outer membrane protein, partial [Treponema sp.]|nr:SusF/SusE family outer membrane protein [Treponema sp.]